MHDLKGFMPTPLAGTVFLEAKEIRGGCGTQIKYVGTVFRCWKWGQDSTRGTLKFTDYRMEATQWE